MKIWYVTDNEDYYEDYIEDYIDDIEFFSSQEAAELACSVKESARKKSWLHNRELNREKYEVEEMARKALDEAGISWDKTALRYSANFKDEEYKSIYQIRVIEVNE